MTERWDERARFLFREDNGVIDAATWRFHVGWLALLLVALTLVLLPLQPFTHHDLATTPFIAPMTILAYGYAILYGFAVLLIAISYVMLSIKRLRDRGKPTGLAGLVPLLALLAGSLHFLRPQVPDSISIWYAVALDALLAIVLVATVIELGVRPTASRRQQA